MAGKEKNTMTCRKRHVKCDKTHPVCQRCKQGPRQCLYQDDRAIKASVTRGLTHVDSSSEGSHVSSNEADVTPDQAKDLAMTDGRPPPSTNSLENTASAEPNFIDRFHTRTLVDLSEVGSNMIQNFSYIPAELRPYLQYFFDNITHYHYGVLRDDDNFFGTTLMDFARGSEALLHAVSAFAAYHRMLGNTNEELPQFLEVYNKSIALLRQLINSGSKPETTMLLAILQLATIAEYLGDGVILAEHRKAAFEILSQLFTPNSIVEISLSGTILSWCKRLGLAAGPLLSPATSPMRH
ncbi:hypothetical protein F5883DRAFT_589234 [Diaporthe sp. PMI_573]|nr:hypothetical protein F5883DRAFT_589234 [Diaporthaceae sp. PMI_573]